MWDPDRLILEGVLWLSLRCSLSLLMIVIKIIRLNKSPYKILIVWISILLSQFELLDQLRQRCQFLLFDQLKFIDEEDEVLKTGVQVVFQT